ncbi:EAL domain-containing protein [Vallitalea guaymasensis]|uniref:EAL domain-containing protein n=2 Tax=Vallitalea guaymasensis TaxID=1185412 RepID=A0A8J8MDY6_9FIRM|nr:EAL domain-containing protein [Vallitalea guaymasensis]QUH31187.1 EAL domain-containing protein [Vallitalea guaymasensis]
MEISENFYYALINNIFSGYAYHKVITDSDGNPVDYEFIDINDDYCNLVGFKREDIIGKRITEIIPSMVDESFDWINFFGKIAIEGSHGSTIQYFKPFDKWYQVNVFSDKKGYFAEIFTDITEMKKKELLLKKKNEQLVKLFEEITASEEELRQQNEKLTQVYEEIAASEEELRQQNEHISGLYEELVASEENLSEQNSLLQESNSIIKEKEQIYRLITQASNDGIWYWNMRDGKRSISYDWYNDLGINLDLFSDIQSWHNILHPDDVEKARKSLKDCIAGITSSYESTYRVRTIRGEYKWIVSRGKTLRDADGKPYLMAGAHIDITNKKIKDDKIKYLAYYDTLTGLPNRAYLLEQVSKYLEKNNKIALIVMDVDNFKSVNDSVGFSIGDIILKQVGLRLSSSIAENDFIARLGGDEFAVILNDVDDNEDIIERANLVKDCFNEPFTAENNIHQLSISLGIAVSPYDGVDSKDLIKNADTAMYKVKNMCKNSISFFTQDMKEEFLKRINIEKQLKKALENNEFKLFYQPQFDMKTGGIRGFEALLRWINPKLGLVSPMTFIPIAEEIGIINEIGEWVLKEACNQYKQWTYDFSFNGIISVNISPIQLKTHNFYNIVSDILKETGIKSGCLELEITENLFIDALDSAKMLLNKLIELGVRISLDDFGTGYSSLSYLKSLPIDTLKIDKSFIKNTTYTGVEREITRSVIDLVRKIGLETIAEGVENDKQLNFLYQSLCDNIQGFLTGKPMPADQVVDIIKAGKVDLSQYIDK